MDALVEEVLKEFLLAVPLVGQKQIQLETMAPAHRSLSVLGKPIKHLVEFPSHAVAYGNHRTVYETRVGHGIEEVACQMFLDEKEVIVLEVAE